MSRSKALTISLFCIAAIVISGWQLSVAGDAKSCSKQQAGCCAKAQPCQSKDQSDARMAENFTLANYDGKEVGLSDYKGKYVVLEWFNYECPFCKYHYETETTMVDLANKYKDKNVQILSINSTKHQTTAQNKAYAEKFNVSWPILDDRTGKVGHLYNATRTPHMFIIDPNGAIIYEGAIDNAPLGKLAEGQELVNYVDKALTEVLAGQPVSTPRTKEYGCTVKYAD